MGAKIKKKRKTNTRKKDNFPYNFNDKGIYTYETY